MKTHWFTVLNAAGIVLLAGQVFGGELQWKKPANGEAAVIRIPAVISTDNAVSPSPIRQVQAVQPIQPPMAPVLDQRYLDPRPQSFPVPPGATIQGSLPRNDLPLPSQKVPVQEEESVPVRVENSQNTSPIPSQQVPSQRVLVRVENRTAIPCDGQVPLKAIREISHDIRPKNTGELPEECVMNNAPFDGRHFSQSCVQWKASAVCTKGAYFEDVQLERYGHTVVCPALQPVVSGAKFFATVPFLPYKMGVTPPNECVYSLGYYRSGSRSPYMAQPVPISARGALFQAGAVAGAIAVLP